MARLKEENGILHSRLDRTERQLADLTQALQNCAAVGDVSALRSQVVLRAQPKLLTLTLTLTLTPFFTLLLG